MEGRVSLVSRAIFVQGLWSEASLAKASTRVFSVRGTLAMEKCWKMLISHRALARYFAMLDSTIIGPIGSQAHSQSGSGSADVDGDTVLERELDRGEPGLLSLAVLRLAQRHRTPDKSIAGAEVILGGFATVVFGAIFAYIRVTSKRSSDTKA
ncbi:hypothetical protein BHE74_00030882 [Ensete ventricosum]|nr:hypothetical protein BHE74_00030882 [Ensete ventricosum]